MKEPDELLEMQHEERVAPTLIDEDWDEWEADLDCCEDDEEGCE